jgi:cation:H+ antiporter
MARYRTYGIDSGSLERRVFKSHELVHEHPTRCSVSLSVNPHRCIRADSHALDPVCPQCPRDCHRRDEALAVWRPDCRTDWLGGLWIGVVLLAAATSLPEVLTTVSAAVLQAPDLAAGDLFGAVMSNMLTLGVIDLLHRQQRVWQHAAYEHTLTAALAITLTSVAGLFTLLKLDLALWGVGLDSAVIATTYVLGMRVVYCQEEVRRRERERERLVEAGERAGLPSGPTGLRRAGVGFAAAALAIVGAAPMLASAAQQIAELTGIGTTFIGTFLVAVTTPLPELVTSLAAVRLRAFDLAVGNLFGSNAVNMSIFFLTDVAYRPGPILSAISGTHAVTAFLGILLMNIGLMGILYRAERRFLLVEPDSLLMILGYGLGMWVVFELGS